MPTDLTDFPTASNPELDIGTGADIVRVGDSVSRIFGWDVRSTNPITGNEECEFEPADFTGYTTAGNVNVLDKDGVILLAFVVTPSVGDITGTFQVDIASVDVTEALKASAVRWEFRLTAGPTTFTLIFARFRIT